MLWDLEMERARWKFLSASLEYHVGEDCCIDLLAADRVGVDADLVQLQEEDLLSLLEDHKCLEGVAFTSRD